MSTYTLKLYRGRRKLVLERAYNLNEQFVDEICKDAGVLIGEAIETNDGALVRRIEEEGIER